MCGVPNRDVFNRIRIDAKKVGATFIGSGTHKGLLVPQGLGLLYWDRARTELEPAYLATISLENPPADFIARPDDMAPALTAGRFELGNFNLPAIQGLGAALDLINEIGIEKIEAHCGDLGDRLIAGLDALNIKLVGPRDRANRAPHIYVAALPADEWIDYFATKDVRVSPERDGVRISLAMFNTSSDIDASWTSSRSAAMRPAAPPRGGAAPSRTTRQQFNRYHQD
ncbi:aminotransferase class V-fold PLP-dependent enzyme [Mesorhizobium sp. M0136]|uniref:aminotransferase class V-fold PLP-dependent enzyme n=1 Tax=Mesorhizobium sp. M0136 TaxID=2956890 RepID=UPI00333854E7